jgi:hypothetical protein
MKKFFLIGIAVILIFVACFCSALNSQFSKTANINQIQAKLELGSDLNAPPIEWHKTYAGYPVPPFDDTLDTFHAGIQTADGGYALVGQTFLSDGAYFWLVRADEYGGVLWNKTYGKSNAEAFSVIQTSDGGFILAGEDNDHALVIMTDSNGQLQNWNYSWQNDYSGFYSIAKTLDGKYVVAGFVEVGYPWARHLDFFLVKLDSALNELWRRNYDAGGNEVALSVIQASDGGYVLVGDTTSGDSGSSDAWLVKTDSSGNTGTGWAQKYGGKGDDTFVSVVEVGIGEYLAGGRTGSYGPDWLNNPWLVLCQQPHQPLKDWRTWDAAYESLDDSTAAVNGIVKDDTGGYIIAFNDGLAYVDSEGNPVWVKKFDSTYGAYYHASSVIKTRDGSYAFAGTELVGGNYVFCLIKLDIEPVHVSVPLYKPTNPPPFVNSTVPRQWEPVQISVSMFGNRTHKNVDTALLVYGVDSSEWCNTTMNYNSNVEQWIGTIPGQPPNATVAFYVEGWIGPSSNTSTIISYVTVPLIEGDINGNGIVDVFDAVILAAHAGETGI